jgi:hypothetical protein
METPSSPEALWRLWEQSDRALSPSDQDLLIRAGWNGTDEHRLELLDEIRAELARRRLAQEEG